MQINVAGKGVDIGESLRQHAEGRLSEAVNKYLDRIVSLDVVVSKEGHNFHISINGNTGTSSNITIKSSALAPDVYAAFDAAVDKIETQLRRYKRKITDHHKQSIADEFSGVKYVISSEEKEAEVDQPIIIAEKATGIYTLSVSDAVMRMDLADLPALMFRNAANGRLNVVYRRVDGNISWVDPAEENKASKVA